MGRSGQKKEKHVKSDELSLDDCNEGGAARTRPISFDEIMVRRKKKNSSEDNNEDVLDVGNVPGDCIVENASNDHESERRHRHNKDSFSGVDVHISNERVKVGSGKKEDNTLTKNGGSFRQKDRESRVSETKLKEDCVAKPNQRRTIKSEIRLKDRSPGNEKDREIRGSETKSKAEVPKETSAKAKGKNEKLISNEGRIYDRSIFDSRDEATKKHSQDSTGKDRHADKCGEKYERESKRKHRNGDDDKNRNKSAAKKADLGKGHYSKPSERKERNESPKSLPEESRLKKRRSRSQEREDRNKRSISLSPRAQKRTSYYDREHEEQPSHSIQNRSGRQHSDTDRSRVVSNGSSGHYRRRGGSTSGLGGYSPRKRRTEAAAKTPSPIIRSPEKKSAKWDIAPVETFSVPSNVQTPNRTAPSNAHEIVSSDPDISTATKPLAGISIGASSAKLNISTDSVQLTQANRPMRRLYVENVPVSVSEKALMEFLNNLLLSSGVKHIHGSLPCIECVILREKDQAILEFLTAEDASAALSCDGCSFSGSILKIKRPKEFVEVASDEADKLVASVDSISAIVKDSPYKIFVGGISKTLSSKMVMEIVCAFGPLKAYHFEDQEEPCAFMEYVDEAVTPKAIAGLNGMKVGGRVLTAVQAVLEGSTMDNCGNPPFYGTPEHAVPLLKMPTEVLKLKNVFNPEGFSSLSEPEVEEILEDVRVECARFGTVKSVNVVKYGDSQITTVKACEEDASMASAAVGQNFMGVETIQKGESLEEATNHQSTKNNELEFPNDSKEVETSGEGYNVKDNKPAGYTIGDEPSQLRKLDSDVAVEDRSHDSTTDTVSHEFPAHANALKDESCSRGDEVISNIQLEDMGVEDKSSAKEELNLEETKRNSAEASAGTAVNVEMQSSAIENGENENQDTNQVHIFELGCIFVEYRRTEASCTAAHSLHRRLFDDRIVTVEYVPLDLYRSRFPK